MNVVNITKLYILNMVKMVSFVKYILLQLKKNNKIHDTLELQRQTESQ